MSDDTPTRPIGEGDTPTRRFDTPGEAAGPVGSDQAATPAGGAAAGHPTAPAPGAPGADGHGSQPPSGADVPTARMGAAPTAPLGSAPGGGFATAAGGAGGGAAGAALSSEGDDGGRRSRGLLWALIALGVLLLAAIVVIVLLLGGREPAPVATSAAPTPSETPSESPTPSETPSEEPEPEPEPEPDPVPEIASFDASTMSVDCTQAVLDGQSSVPVTFSWSASADQLWFGVGTDNARSDPYDTFPLTYTLEFPYQCGQASGQQRYTISVELAGDLEHETITITEE